MIIHPCSSLLTKITSKIGDEADETERNTAKEFQTQSKDVSQIRRRWAVCGNSSQWQ